ncbi:hypothetical protein K1X84_16550, partial [bacterium]|nr:hypothetical protein [bacterium]
MRSIILSAMLVLLMFGNAAAQSDVVFSDDFYSNTNNWYEGSTKDYYFKVQNGYYTFDNTSETTWMIAKDVGLSSYDNFSAEATIKKISGIDNNLYGIVWGYKTSNDCYTFGLSGDGNYLYGKWSNGNWVSLISWTLSSSINKYAGALNTIKVERNGSTVSFYINGTFVNSATWEAPLGNQVGFVSTNRQRMDVDKLTVRKITGSSQYSSYGGGGGSFDAVLKNTVSYQLSGEYNRGGAISPDGQK